MARGVRPLAGYPHLLDGAQRRLLGPFSAGTDDWPLSATAGARPLNAGPSESICRPWFTSKLEARRMTDTPRLWDRRADETPKSYAAFRAYVALGARRSVREAARQHHSKALSAREILGQENTTVSTWLAWSSKHKWVSRANARDEWIARTSDDQIVSNVTACKLALTTRAHDFLTSTDSEVFLRGARAFTLQHPPIQRVADVSERIEDLSEPKGE